MPPKPEAEVVAKEEPPLPFDMPSGFQVAKVPPTAEQLTFANEEGDALVGRHIMFNWDEVGWCEGIVDERNTDEKSKIGKDFVNFLVHYAIDNNTSKHNLEIKFYKYGPKAPTDSWVMLERIPEGGAASSSAADAAAVEEVAAVEVAAVEVPAVEVPAAEAAEAAPPAVPSEEVAQAAPE